MRNADPGKRRPRKDAKRKEGTMGGTADHRREKEKYGDAGGSLDSRK